MQAAGNRVETLFTAVTDGKMVQLDSGWLHSVVNNHPVGLPKGQADGVSY